jgi:aspartate kinase
MRTVVMKFGGTSVQTREARMAAALRVISARERGEHPVVVVSAIGRKGEPYATDTLIGFLREIEPDVEPEPRELDLLMACGEILSSVVFAHTLKALGHGAISLRGGQAGIRTDGNYGNARILGINPLGVIEALRRGMIPVVCGFQGVWVQGGLPGAELTTLGRGGSDTTAAGLGAALRADRVEIFTDVDGVKTADPDYVPHAPTLSRVSYSEVAEIAHLGAKVLHPRAAEIGMRFGIPIWVKNTFTDEPGTKIVAESEAGDRRVTGVTHAGKLVALSIDMGAIPPEGRAGFAAEVFRVLAENSVSLHMVGQHPLGFGFAVPRDQFAAVRSLLDALVVPVGDVVCLCQVGDPPSGAFHTQARLVEGRSPVCVAPFTVTEGCTMVSVVGRDYMGQPGVYLGVLEVLARENVPVVQTSDSESSLSCLIPESELRRAVHALHEAFQLHGAA